MKTNKNYLIIKIKIIDDKHLLNNFYSKKHRIQQYERGKSFTNFKIKLIEKLIGDTYSNICVKYFEETNKILSFDEIYKTIEEFFDIHFKKLEPNVFLFLPVYDTELIEWTINELTKNNCPFKISKKTPNFF